ncbi:heavy-metal-associated domain-containing protein [Magnetospira sp. QH-2]|uniref:heavy-metal-associated domain-containing protein n=1 Tax=Magnetospira sp. (strain QH-2) TaxID=1288970 RepID=UPI0003E812DC|nr:heavy metal-associated domain-containing protein [Magnetospira sp. QH-2]CCQ74439.1 putative Heavy metal transport/detoxification protein [Magnetospira sp. QH-2]
MAKYLVNGMTCGGCASSVEKAIKELAADSTVTVDLEAKTVTVGGVDDAAVVQQAVENAGFEFNGPA